MDFLKHPIVQYAYFVNDLQSSCLKWAELFGAGPFFLNMHHKSERVTYRGEPSDPDVSYAFGQAGPAQIQLVQQHDDTPSCYWDMFQPGEEGLHHVAVLVPDFDGEKVRFERLGYPAVTELVSGARVAYMDARAAIGCFVELYEDNDGTRETFRRWTAAHESWDGRTDPIRDLEESIKDQLEAKGMKVK